MKKLLFFMILFLIPFSINAACNYEDKNELSSLAKHIDYDYDYAGNIYNYKITINNVTSNFKILYNYNTYNPTNNKVVLPTITKGADYKIQIYTSDTAKCPNVYIRDIYLNLPVYNVFSEREECKEHSDFKYCAKFLTREISEEEFIEEYEKLIAEEEVSEYVSTVENKEEDKANKVLDFLKEPINWLIILSVLLLGLIIFVIIKIIKTKKM